MDCMRTGISGTRLNFTGIQRFNEFRCLWVLLDIKDIDMRTAQCWHNEVTPFYIGVWCVRAECCTTRIPTEVVDFITNTELQPMDHLAVGVRRFVEVNHTHSVGVAVISRCSDIGDIFNWCLNRHLWGRIKGRIGSPLL